MIENSNMFFGFLVEGKHVYIRLPILGRIKLDVLFGAKDDEFSDEGILAPVGRAVVLSYLRFMVEL